MLEIKNYEKNETDICIHSKKKQQKNEKKIKIQTNKQVITNKQMNQKTQTNQTNTYKEPSINNKLKKLKIQWECLMI